MASLGIFPVNFEGFNVSLGVATWDPGEMQRVVVVSTKSLHLSCVGLYVNVSHTRLTGMYVDLWKYMPVSLFGMTRQSWHKEYGCFNYWNSTKFTRFSHNSFSVLSHLYFLYSLLVHLMYMFKIYMFHTNLGFDLGYFVPQVMKHVKNLVTFWCCWSPLCSSSYWLVS